MKPKQAIERLLDLQEKYSFEKRHLVTSDRYEQIHQTGFIPKGAYDHEALREPLLEHVGHLPVMAAFLHPYIEHSDQVDLGKVLTMLAVHDIGETEVGDVFTYDKTENDESTEYEVALSLLEPAQKTIYVEFEKRESFEAKFAKSIDALAPITHSMYRPQVKIDRFKMKGRTVRDIIDKKTQYYVWDSFLEEVFALCIEHYLRIEKGEKGIFLVKE